MPPPKLRRLTEMVVPMVAVHPSTSDLHSRNFQPHKPVAPGAEGTYIAKFKEDVLPGEGSQFA